MEPFFPGYFGFYNQGKYYVVQYPNSRKEVLGKRIVSEINQALLDGEFETWKSKIENIDNSPNGDLNQVNFLSDILENRIYDRSHSGIPNFENFSYVVNLDTNQLNFYEGYRVINNYHLDLYFLPKW